MPSAAKRRGGSEQHDPAAVLAGECEQTTLPGGVATKAGLAQVEHDESECARAQEQLGRLERTVTAGGPGNVHHGERGEIDAAVREVRGIERSAGGLDPHDRLLLRLGEPDGTDGGAHAGSGTLPRQLDELSGGKRLQERRVRERGKSPGGLDMREHRGKIARH